MPIKKKEAVTAAVVETKEPFNSLRWLLSTISHKVNLDFGINENCRLIAIDNTERKREGEIINKNTYLTFAKFNSEGKIIGQTEFSYFNLKAESEYTPENLATQLSQLISLAQCLTGTDANIDPVADFKSEKELEKALSTDAGCKKLQDKLFDQFKEAITGHYGNESELLRIKVVTEKTGKYMQLPKDAIFTEKMSSPSNLRVTVFEQKTKDKALQPATASADKTGDAPDKSTKKSSIIHI